MITFDPPSNVGGIEGRANNYARELVKMGHIVEIISFSSRGDFSSESLHGATLLNFPSSSKRVISAYRKTISEISHNSIQSIFLLSGALTLYGMMILFYARWKGIRTLALFYGKDILSAKQSFSASLALRLSPRLAKKIVANSRYTAGLLPKKFSKKIEILYPSVDPSIAKESPASDIEKKQDTLLSVGRLVKRKGVDDLLRAFSLVLKNLPNTQLEIVGDGPELTYLKNLAIQLGVDSDVTFFGMLSGPPLYQRYRECDIFVMPSKTSKTDVEGFGTVFLEAGVFAKPSIGTFSGGIPEAIKDGVTGLLVQEENIEKLAEAIEKLLTNKPLAREMGENAKKMVLTEFTWEVMTHDLYTMLESHDK